MTLKQSICNTASCREVRKDIGRFLDELRQSDLNCPAEVVEKITRWHGQIREAENAQANPVFQLQERIKELNCLYTVIETLQTSRPDLKFEQTLRKALEVIPDGFQHPERTGVALQVREHRYTTPLFTESGLSLVTTCLARDGVRIELHVSLKPDNGSGNGSGSDNGDGNGDSTKPAFLEEEQALLQKIVRLFRRFYHHQLNVAGLADREEQFRTTIYSIGDGVITTDRNGHVDKMNPAAEKLTGWTEEEARGHPVDQVFRIISEHSRQPVTSPVQKVLEHGTVAGLANHTLLISRDGRETPIADSGSPIKTESGKITGVVLVFQEQTEERALQRALKESEKKFRDMVEYAPEPIAIVTGERFAYLNPAATTLYGADDPCRLDGTPVMDRIHPDFHEEVATRLQQMAGGDKAHDDSSQQLHLRCDGSHVWVDVVCSPIHHEGNESVLLFIRDITRQIEYEKQIRSNLREKEVMLAEIHHRVKNNLAVISGLLELEAGLSERPEIVDVLRKAENRVRSMALIHEKLYKSESLADIDFQSYIRELADFVQGYFSRRNLDAEIHFDLEPVRLDVTRAVPCGIIVNEILTNGLKYAFAGREQGNITLILRESDGEIRLTYRDDGVGMPEETLEQLQAGRAPSLGLELISALTRQLNGTLDISSDGGTHIALRFPGGGE